MGCAEPIERFCQHCGEPLIRGLLVASRRRGHLTRRRREPARRLLCELGGVGAGRRRSCRRRFFRRLRRVRREPSGRRRRAQLALWRAWRPGLLATRSPSSCSADGSGRAAPMKRASSVAIADPGACVCSAPDALPPPADCAGGLFRCSPLLRCVAASSTARSLCRVTVARRIRDAAPAPPRARWAPGVWRPCEPVT